MEAITTYFDKPGGDENTARTLELAKKRADELGIKTVVVASTVGGSAAKAVGVFKGFKVVVVTHVAGFREPNSQEFTVENRAVVEKAGALIVTTTHAFGGVHRALAQPGSRPAPSNIMGDTIAMTLRTFGQGMKVCLECAAMAADAGHLNVDEDCISIGGTGRGADTAIVIQPNYVHHFFQSRVKEIICKPRL
jgi:hypothetical protein